MATVDYLLQLSSVPGNSKDPSHRGWIRIQSFSLGARGQPGVAPSFNDIHVTTDIDDLNYAALMLHAQNGQHIESARFDVWPPPGGDGYQYIFTDAVVANAQLSGRQVQFSLNFKAVQQRFLKRLR